MSAKIVVDLGFGDSGKGLTVDYLAAQNPDTSLVVRFSGGHQVGHTVVRDGKRHTFSNFGAGTLLGVPTYYLPETTIFPPAALVERAHLSPIRPKVFVHPLTMITTPYDVAYNRATERVNQHGSCGVGFGATVERHLKGIAFNAKDLTNSWVARHKLAAVNNYYKTKVAGTATEAVYRNEIADLDDSTFVETGREFCRSVSLATFDELPSDRPDFVFEGSQGIMLDQIHGLFPHVTRSDTTSKGALAFLRSMGWTEPVDVYYVTRCYQTRHGNGPMSSDVPIALQHDRDEANVENEFQGQFRTGELDVDLLNYALRTDAAYHDGFAVRKHLVITCLDQRPEFDVVAKLKQVESSFATVLVSRGPDASRVGLWTELGANMVRPVLVA